MMRVAIFYWLLSAASLAAGAWLVCPSAQCVAPGPDRFGLSLAHELRGEMLDRLMAVTTRLGSMYLLLPLVGVGATWLFIRRQRRLSEFLLLALLGATALAQVVKLWVARPRPDLFALSLPMPGDASFPSAHSMQAAALGMALFFIINHQRAEWRVPLALVLSALVLLVGVSRIYLQVHYPSDVLAGLFAGAFWVLGLYALMFSQPAKSGNVNATGGKA